MRPLFLVFEGIDGCGKGTQITRLQAWLNERGRNAVIFRDPGTGSGEAIRQLLLRKEHPLTPEQQALLFTAARIGTRNEIVRHMREGQDVLCDRWVMSTFVYQGKVQNVSEELIQALHDHFVKMQPHAYIVLDLPANVAQYRLALANTKEGDPAPDADRFESQGVTFAEQLRKGYRLMAEDTPDAWIVDAEQSPEDVFHDVLDACRIKVEGFTEWEATLGTQPQE